MAIYIYIYIDANEILSASSGKSCECEAFVSWLLLLDAWGEPRGRC